MNKSLLIIFFALLSVFLCSCGKQSSDISSQKKNESPETSQPATYESVTDPSEQSESGTITPSPESNSFDAENGSVVDLTVLSSTVVYAEVYNMMVSPENYIGKTVKMTGQFAVYQDSTTGINYYACIIADATACCSQGLEFVLANEHSYPDDYPALGTEITVLGEFQTYNEGDMQYLHLVNAHLL